MIKRILKIISTSIFIIYVISLSKFALNLSKLNLISNKYIFTFYSVCLIFSFLFVFVLPKLLKIINLGIMILLIGIFYKGINYFTDTYDFFKNIEVSSNSKTYHIIVIKDQQISNITELKDKTIGYVSENKDLIKNKLNEDITYNEFSSNDVTELKETLLYNEVDALCLLSSTLDLLYEEDNEFKNNTQIISTFSFDEDIKPLNVNINNPFILYISGIDTYDDITDSKGRSDVNILAIINPVDNKILLVNTPRDYYVKLHNTTGLKDKITHAGIYGVDMSIKTLEDLYDIDIDYYLKVNFNALVNVVNLIDGIDIYSDSSFTAYTDQSVSIKKGWNHLDGNKALAYARERKNYLTGDNHRGQNQQQIISAIIDKISSTPILLTKYSQILQSLSGTFETNIDFQTILNFINNEKKDKFKFAVTSIQVTGYDSQNYTYSASNSLHYVMEPNMESVNNAKNKIQTYLTT